VLFSLVERPPLGVMEWPARSIIDGMLARVGSVWIILPEGRLKLSMVTSSHSPEIFSAHAEDGGLK
jgi:hypothetical protein